MAKSKQTDAQLKTAMIEIWTKMDRLVAKLPPSRNLDELTDNELDDYRDVLERDREKYDDTYQLFGERYENVKEKKELFDGDDRNWENIDGAHDKFESIAGEIALTIKRIETKKKQRREAIELEKKKRRREAIELEEKREETERRRKRKDDEEELLKRYRCEDEESESENEEEEIRLNDVIHSIPKFDGDYKNWQEFWEVFEALVHTRNAPVIDKFNVLRQSVIGEAAHYVKYRKFEASNYEPSIVALKRMYDQPRFIEMAIREELMKVSPARNDQQVIPTYQKIQMLYGKLQRLGRNVDAEFVSTIFMKLPPSFKEKIEVQGRIDRIDVWTKTGLENVMTVLIQRNQLHRPANNEPSRWNRNEKNERRFDNGKNERRFESEKKRGANSAAMLASSDKKKEEMTTSFVNGNYYGKESIRGKVLLDTSSSKSYIRRQASDRLHAKKIRGDRLTVPAFECQRTTHAEVVNVYLERKNSRTIGDSDAKRREDDILDGSSNSSGERGSFGIGAIIGIDNSNVIKLRETVPSLTSEHRAEIGNNIGQRLPKSDGSNGAIATAMRFAKIGPTHQPRTLSEKRDLHERDQIGKTEEEDYGDQRAFDGHESTVKFEEGRYQATCPRIDDQLKPERNRLQSVKRLESAAKRLGQNDVLMENYEDINDDQRKIISEEAPESAQYRNESKWPPDIGRVPNEMAELEVKRDLVYTTDDFKRTREQIHLVSSEERNPSNSANESDWTKNLDNSTTHGQSDEIERPPNVGETNRADTHWERREQSKYYGEQTEEIDRLRRTVKNEQHQKQSALSELAPIDTADSGSSLISTAQQLDSTTTIAAATMCGVESGAATMGGIESGAATMCGVESGAATMGGIESGAATMCGVESGAAMMGGIESGTASESGQSGTSVSGCVGPFEQDVQRREKSEYYGDQLTELIETKRDVYNSIRLKLDVKGVIRSLGRIENADVYENTKEPVLLPRKSEVTRTIVDNNQRRNHRASKETVIGRKRQRYSTPRLRFNKRRVESGERAISRRFNDHWQHRYLTAHRGRYKTNNATTGKRAKDELFSLDRNENNARVGSVVNSGDSQTEI